MAIIILSNEFFVWKLCDGRNSVIACVGSMLYSMLQG